MKKIKKPKPDNILDGSLAVIILLEYDVSKSKVMAVIKNCKGGYVESSDIPKGAKLERRMITIKRPGYGLEPSRFKSVLGKTVSKKIPQDSLIQDQYLAWKLSYLHIVIWGVNV